MGLLFNWRIVLMLILREFWRDVLVHVDHLIFPTDFYVLEMEESAHSSPMPLLLGRPFMKTAQTKIDVAKGTLSMKFGGDKIKFNVSKPVETSNAIHSCFAIDKIKTIGQECSAPRMHQEPSMTKEGE